MQSQCKQILTVRDVANELRIGLNQAYELFHSEGFRCFRIKGKGKGSLRVTRKNFEAYLFEMEDSYDRH